MDLGPYSGRVDAGDPCFQLFDRREGELSTSAGYGGGKPEFLIVNNSHRPFVMTGLDDRMNRAKDVRLVTFIPWWASKTVGSMKKPFS